MILSEVLFGFGFTNFAMASISLIPCFDIIIRKSPDCFACWFIDTNYNDESFFVRHAYFLGDEVMKIFRFN